MKLPDHIKTYISLCVLAFVGALFVFKYGVRLLHSPVIAGLVTGAYALIYLASLIFIKRIGIPRITRLADQRLFLLVLGVLVVSALGIILFFPETSRVSRLLALKEWLARLLTGSYPWSLSVQYNPSGLPFLFFIALPFYFVGNLGFLEVIGIILFFVSLACLFPQPNTRWVPLIALLLLPSFYYEVLVRSELLFNISLVIILMILAERYLNPDKLNFSFFALAALFGLVLSTRAVVGLIYVAYYAYKFRKHVYGGIRFSVISLLFFSLTLLPFIIWDPHTFFTQGPFYMQLLHLPIGLAGLFVILAVIAGWKADSFQQLIFLSGVLLFLTVGSAFSLTIASMGVNSSIINDGFDITYFIFSVPFLLLSLNIPTPDTNLRGL